MPGIWFSMEVCSHWSCHQRAQWYSGAWFIGNTMAFKLVTVAVTLVEGITVDCLLPLRNFRSRVWCLPFIAHVTFCSTLETLSLQASFALRRTPRTRKCYTPLNRKAESSIPHRKSLWACRAWQCSQACRSLDKRLILNTAVCTCGDTACFLLLSTITSPPPTPTPIHFTSESHHSSNAKGIA